MNLLKKFMCDQSDNSDWALRGKKLNMSTSDKIVGKRYRYYMFFFREFDVILMVSIWMFAALGTKLMCNIL